MTDEAKRRSVGRPRTTDPDHVLEVAMHACWAEDPADVSVNAICRMAGVSKPSLYRHFTSEDGLMRATLDRYAEQVLTDLFILLQAGRGLRETLDALVAFACDDPRMEKGCLYYKMRSGKHRLGPETRARVDELDALSHGAYAAFLRSCRLPGVTRSEQAIDARARYLSEQIGLGITLRSSGEDPERVREMLTLALSVFRDT